MADLTLRLLWYKLNETVSNMADTGSTKMGWFSWEEHLLDVLLIFWIGCGGLVVCVVNTLLTFFGPLQPRVAWSKAKETLSDASIVPVGPLRPESCGWLNTALNWAYLHYGQFPEFVDAWVVALNEQATKLGGPVQVKFERVQSGSLPPKFGDVTYDAGPDDKYVFNCRVDSRDLSFAVFASQQTHEGVKLTNLIINILKLRGSLKINCFRDGDNMMANITFHGRPDIKVQGKPVNPYQEPSDMVDIGVTEEVVRNSICLASTTFNVTKWITGEQSSPLLRPLSREHHPSGSSPSSPRQLQQPVFEPIEMKEQQQSAFRAPTSASPPSQSLRRQHQPQQQQQAYLGRDDKRLLVKVIKASGLKQSDTGTVDPYCIVYVDTPPATEVTSVVRSSLNPFWDEQFFFDMTPTSQELRFEILDKRRPAKDNFLGEALVYCEDLRRNPSSRQIIPLQGRLGVGEFVSGSITVEFLCMDVGEESQMSPRRTIETSKSVTPGGTLVTETMTTTHRHPNSRLEASYDGSPSYIEKREFDYDQEHISPGSGGAYYPQIPTIENAPSEDYESSAVTSNLESPELAPAPKEKKKSLAAQIRKRFSRSKKRSHSADRASSSLREGSNYLRPPASGSGYGGQSKDDMELVRNKQHDGDVPNLKKSRSLGGSLKKLFRRSRKRSRSRGRGDQSRESSVSRQSRHTSQGPSREGSLNRNSQTPSQNETMVL